MAENAPLERRQQLVLEQNAQAFREQMQDAFTHGWTLAPGALAVATCWDHAGHQLGSYAAVLNPPVVTGGSCSVASEEPDAPPPLATRHSSLTTTPERPSLWRRLLGLTWWRGWLR